MWAAACHFSYLSWGLPSWKKHLQIFGSREEAERWAKPILELRKKYYAAHGEMMTAGKSESESRALYKEIFQSFGALPPFIQLPEAMLLDRMRGYLLGAVASDEQYPLAAIATLKPQEFDFKPKIYALNGCFYYYAGGAALFAAKLTGWLKLVPSVEFYFLHPEETAKMYKVMRALGGISLLASIVLLFFWLRKAASEWTALWAAAFLAALPGNVLMTHMVKPHLIGMFLILLGLYFFWRSGEEEPKRRDDLLGAAFLGLAAGTLVTNLAAGIIIFLTEWARADWKPLQVLRSKRFWLLSLVFLAVYCVTNAYVISSPGEVLKMVWAHKEYTRGYDEYGTLNLGGALHALKMMFTTQVHWTLIPLILLGLWAAFKSTSKMLKVCALSFLALNLLNLLSTRHNGVTARTFFLFALFAGLGADLLFKASWRWGKFTVGTCIALALFFSGLQTLFYVSLYREPSNYTQAGDWVNEQVPKNSSIGTIYQIIAGNFPPIRFLDYRIVKLPDAASYQPTAFKQLPDYVITPEALHASPPHPLLSSHYALAQEWRRPRGLLGLEFSTEEMASDNSDLFVFKKNPEVTPTP